MDSFRLLGSLPVQTTRNCKSILWYLGRLHLRTPMTFTDLYVMHLFSFMPHAWPLRVAPSCMAAFDTPPPQHLSLPLRRRQDVERIRNAMSHSNQDKTSLPRWISGVEDSDAVRHSDSGKWDGGSWCFHWKTASSCRKRLRVINGLPRSLYPLTTWRVPFSLKVLHLFSVARGMIFPNVHKVSAAISWSYKLIANVLLQNQLKWITLIWSFESLVGSKKVSDNTAYNFLVGTYDVPVPVTVEKKTQTK